MGRGLGHGSRQLYIKGCPRASESMCNVGVIRVLSLIELSSPPGVARLCGLWRHCLTWQLCPWCPTAPMQSVLPLSQQFPVRPAMPHRCVPQFSQRPLLTAQALSPQPLLLTEKILPKENEAGSSSPKERYGSPSLPPLPVVNHQRLRPPPP